MSPTSQLSLNNKSIRSSSMIDEGGGDNSTTSRSEVNMKPRISIHQTSNHYLSVDLDPYSSMGAVAVSQRKASLQLAGRSHPRLQQPQPPLGRKLIKSTCDDYDYDNDLYVDDDNNDDYSNDNSNLVEIVIDGGGANKSSSGNNLDQQQAFLAPDVSKSASINV